MEEGLLHGFSELLVGKAATHPALLMVLALFGGLLSSLSPCVLGLLPVNLAYIGTAHIESKEEAFQKASMFVLGVALVLTMLGLFGSLAFAVFTEYKGPINLVVGVFIITMALFVMEVIKIPLPQVFQKVPEASPFVIGMVFALVSSPCSSPVLFGVLTVASSTASPIWSMFIMFCYSLGYTAIIFFASLFTGLVRQLGWFKEHNRLILKVSGSFLILMGIFYLSIGIKEVWL